MTKTLAFTFIALALAAGPRVPINALSVQSNQQTPSDEGAKQLTEAANLNSTVVKLFGEGKFDEALPLARRVLEIRERLLPADDERVASAVINIAEIYDATKKLGDAQTFLERALRSYEKKFGRNDLRVATVLDRLGSVYFNRSLDPEAERALLRAISIKEQTLGAEDATLANSLDNLGQFYRLRGDVKKAEPPFDRALMIMQRALPEDSPATKNLVKHYSCLLYETRQTDKIKGLFHKYSPAKEVVRDPDYSGPNGGVLNGRAVRLVTPSYPVEAQRAHASGVVVISVLIDETGKVIEAHDTCGADPTLVKPSIQAAYLSQFTSTKLSGQPVKVNGVIVYNFVRQ